MKISSTYSSSNVFSLPLQNIKNNEDHKVRSLGDGFKPAKTVQDGEPTAVEKAFSAAKESVKKEATAENLMALARAGVNYYDVKTNLGDKALLANSAGKAVFEEAIQFFNTTAQQLRGVAGDAKDANPISLRADFLDFRALSLKVLTTNSPDAVVELVSTSVTLSKINPKQYDAKEAGYPLQTEEADNIRISAVIMAGAVHSRAPHILAGISRARGIEWLMSGVVYSRKGVDLGEGRKTLTGDPVSPYLFVAENMMDVKERNVAGEAKEVLAAFNKWNKANAALNPDKKEFATLEEAIGATLAHVERQMRDQAALKYEKPIAQNILGVCNTLRARLELPILETKSLKFFEN